MITTDEIVNRWQRRKAAMGALHAVQVDLRNHYNGDVVYPLPELDKNEKGFVANLITQGLDQMGMRIASTMPTVWYPPASEAKVQTDRATDKRLATLAWWDMNRLNLKMRRRARFFLGYSAAPVMITPNHDRDIPMWTVIDPLGAYPAPTADPDDICPPDCIMASTRPLWWLKQKYPQEASRLIKGADRKNTDKLFDVLRFVDDAEDVVVVVGSTPDETSSYSRYNVDPDPDGTEASVELGRVPNRAGICPVVYPGRITLDRPMGAFDTILGMHDMQAMLMSLEMIAVKRAIFPDEWLVARPNEQPAIVRPANGLTGTVGLAKGGAFQTQQLNPGFQTQPMIDRLEAGQRRGAGIPQEFGGESTSNIRTGRRGDAVMAAAVDMPIQEAQEVFQASLAEENVRAIAVSKAYFGAKKKSFYVGSKGTNAQVDYTPNDLFDTDFNIVRYSAPGSDINQLVTTGGQRVGIGTMSKRTFMEIDPLIEDPDREHRQVLDEAMEQALLASLQQQAEQGQLPAADLGRIAELVLTKKMPLWSAVDQAHKEAQERQASQAPPPGADGQPAPGQMPGLAAPGAGAEQQPAPQIGPPPVSSQNLQAILGSLHQQPAPQAAAS